MFTSVLFSPHLPLLSEGEFKTGQVYNILKYISLITTVSGQIQDVVKLFESVPGRKTKRGENSPVYVYICMFCLFTGLYI